MDVQTDGQTQVLFVRTDRQMDGQTDGWVGGLTPHADTHVCTLDKPPFVKQRRTEQICLLYHPDEAVHFDRLIEV